MASASTGILCPKRETAPSATCGNTAVLCFGNSGMSWWIYLRHGFHVIQGCNPPDDIFLVALPFKLFGVKYIFDHHDAKPELYLLKVWQPGISLQSTGLAGKADVPLQRRGHGHQRQL